MKKNTRFWPPQTSKVVDIVAKTAGKPDQTVVAITEPSPHMISVALEKRLLTLIANPFPRNPILWPEQYRQYVNRIADYLFDIFLE